MRRVCMLVKLVAVASSGAHLPFICYSLQWNWSSFYFFFLLPCLIYVVAQGLACLFAIKLQKDVCVSCNTMSWLHEEGYLVRGSQVGGCQLRSPARPGAGTRKGRRELASSSSCRCPNSIPTSGQTCHLLQ